MKNARIEYNRNEVRNNLCENKCLTEAVIEEIAFYHIEWNNDQD